MSRQDRGTRLLAARLSNAASVAVDVDWYADGRCADGYWLVEWVDGHTSTRMRVLAAAHAEPARPPTNAGLRYLHLSRTAWAATMITMKDRSVLPRNTRDAVTLAEHELADTDAAA